MDDRDQEILELYESGMALPEIATLLGISPREAQASLRRALHKRHIHRALSSPVTLPRSRPPINQVP
jgi:DNA-binding CsgD family transcriptional regulator